MGDEPDTITEEEFATWLTPASAKTELGELGSSALVVGAILGRLATGEIKAVARRMTASRGPENLVLVRWEIPAKVWEESDAAQHFDAFWKVGDITFDLPRGGGRDASLAARCTHVRFSPDGVRDLVPPPATIVHGGVRRVDHFAAERAEAQMEEVRSPAPESIGRRPGRPAKDFWEDAAVAVCATWFKGQLLPPPARLADVERAFADWISRSGHSATESVIREHAKKVWDALKD